MSTVLQTQIKLFCSPCCGINSDGIVETVLLHRKLLQGRADNVLLGQRLTLSVPTYIGFNFYLYMWIAIKHAKHILLPAGDEPLPFEWSYDLFPLMPPWSVSLSKYLAFYSVIHIGLWGDQENPGQRERERWKRMEYLHSVHAAPKGSVLTCGPCQDR